MISKKRRIKASISIVICILVLTTFVSISTANAATWESSEKFGYWTDEGYTMNNDIWGSGSGDQTIWANSYSNWGVWGAQPETDNVKSYPHVGKLLNKKLSEINTLQSSFNVEVPSNYTNMETAYDIWLDNNAHEIMLWMNKSGDVKPISYKYDALGNAIPVEENVNIGGYTWNVYVGNNGGNMVYSFLKVDGNINSGTVDIKEIINWIEHTKQWFGDVVIGDVQFGFEITSSYNNGMGHDFVTNSLSITYN
jgi:hypothetical protein